MQVWQPNKLRLALLLASLASTLFVVYASLVPLAYHPLPLDETWTRFLQIPWLQLAVNQRADWVANGLVLLPSGFCAAGAIDWRRRSRWPLLLTSPWIVMVLAAVVIGIEFVQIWFPPRVVSQNDMLAGIIGSLGGVLLWWCFGRRLVAPIERFAFLEPGTEKWKILVTFGMLGICLYNLMPLDIVMSSTEWRDKTAADRLVLIPLSDFAFTPKSTFFFAYAGLRIVPYCLLAAKLVPPRTAILNGCLWALLFELLKVPVYSRTASMTNVMAGMLGAVIAVKTSPVFWRVAKRLDRSLVWLLAATSWSVVMLAGFLGRFERIVVEPQQIQQRLQGILAIPFARAHSSSEFEAGENILFKVLIFAILSFLLSSWYSRLNTKRNQKRSCLSWSRAGVCLLIFIWIVGLAVGIEVGQVFLFPLIPDVTDFIVYALGAGVGLAASRWLLPIRSGIEIGTPITHATCEPALHRSRGQIPRRILALALALLVVIAGSQHATAPLTILAGCGLLFAICLAWETAWLTAIPVCIVVGSWYPWTGQMRIEERDLFLASILAAVLWNTNKTLSVPKRAIYLWLPYISVVSGACIQAMQVLPTAVSGDEWSLYTTRNNTLVMYKALVTGLAFAPFFLGIENPKPAWRGFSLGMQLSALVVVTTVVAERLVTNGLFDFSEELRVTGPFASMHIGGQHIDAYWGLALPFVFQFQTQKRITTLAVWLLQLLSLYAIYASMSRALIAYAVVSIVCLAILKFCFSILNSRTRSTSTEPEKREAFKSRRYAVAYCLLGAISLFVVGGGLWRSGEAVRMRFASTAADWNTRVEHWQKILDVIAASDWKQRYLGHGLGTYPTVIRKASGLPPQPIAMIDNHTVKLYAGEQIYLEQWIEPHIEFPITATVNCVKSEDCRVHVLVCRKILLQSFECTQGELLPLASAKSELQFEFPASAPHAMNAGTQLWRRMCPTTFGFSISGAPGEFVSISNVRVSDARGISLIENGDFQRGSQRWFFTCDNHLIWRAKNMWLNQAVEMGWLGVAALAVLVFGTLGYMLRGIWIQRQWHAVLSLWSLLGFLLMGLFGSLLDAPWLLTFFLVVSALSLSLPREWVDDRRHGSCT